MTLLAIFPNSPLLSVLQTSAHGHSLPETNYPTLTPHTEIYWAGKRWDPGSEGQFKQWFNRGHLEPNPTRETLRCWAEHVP